MKKIFRAALLMAAVMLWTSGCGKGSGNDSLMISSDVAFGENDYKQIVSANNTLGFNMLAKVKPDENGNILISPTSLFMALSMVYNGADGLTKEEIADVLQVDGIEIDELNKANASLLTKLYKHANDIQLNVANSIWLNEAFHFQDDFARN